MMQLIQPLEFFLHWIFTLLLQWTSHYGLSILLLSTAVNIILLPVYYPIEKLKKRWKIKYRDMDREIQEIKDCYSGQERYYYIQALHRQYRYNPFQALLPSLGLLIQIPFFLAAYYMLSHYTGLQGISFWFIQDLSLADQTINMGFGRWNILPIIMTALNGISTLFYTKDSKASERYQLWILAVLFLVLLYNSPAALVLYWTMNNIFALLKQAARYLHQIREIRFPNLRAYASRRNCIYYSLYVLCLFFGLSTLSYYDNSTMTPIYLLSTLLIFLWIIQLWHIAEIGVKNGKRWYHWIFLTILPAMIAFQIYYAWPLFQDFFQYELNIMYGIKTAMLLCVGIVIGYPLVLREIGNPLKGIIPGKKCSFGSFIMPVTFIFSVLFLWIPTLVYQSLPSIFEQSIWSILLLNGIYALTAILAAAAGYRFLFRRGQWVISFVVSMLAFFVFLYAYVIKFNFGSLDGMVLTQSQSLRGHYPWYLLEFILLMTGGWGIYRIMKRNPRILGIGFAVLISLSTMQGSAALWNIAQLDTQNGEADLIPSNTDKLLSFSKDNENIVIFMLDMFQGNYVTQILAESPELKNRLEGFIWYPNSLSVSFYTNASLPVIMGGWDFEALNQNKQPGNLLGKNTRAYEDMIARAQDKNMDVSVVDATYFHTLHGDIEAMEDLGVYSAQSSQFRNFWLDHTETDQEDRHISRRGLLTAISLFRVLPYAFKAPVYNKGTWFTIEQSNYTQTIKKVSFLRSMPLLANNQSQSATFKFFISEITHSPFAIDKEGKVLTTGVPDPSHPTGTGGLNAYYSAYWALTYVADFMDWMKEAEVYDNSRIILVSDHGNHYYPNAFDVPYQSLEEASKLNINSGTRNRLNVLLMMKDFDSEGPLQVSNQFMSNGDTMSLVYGEDLKDFDAVIDGRTLPCYTTRHWETRMLQHSQEYIIEEYYYVTDNLFDLKNWERIR